MTMVVRSLHQMRRARRRPAVSLSASSDEVASSSKKKRRVAQNGARDGDALALAARERDAALADRRVESLRQRGDEGSGMCVLGGTRDLGIGSVRAAEADIVAHGGGEHHAVLRHQRDARAQFRRIEIREPHAVERDACRRCGS